MQETTSTNTKRLAKNTIFLYVRMIIIMSVSLYTARVVLNVLGVVDFGVYNVIGGLVAMFGLVNGALGAAVSRFLNIEMGRGNEKNLKRVFSTSVSIHIILALLLIIVAELFGPWFVENKMTIPVERMNAALWVFHCSMLTFAVNLLSVPYNGCIIAHENMKVYAYVSILEAVMKLLVVYFLALSSFDKLKLYAILILLLAIIIRITYQVYCIHHYKESKFLWHLDIKMVRNMFSFASWNLIGSTSVIFAEHGVNILINLFCSPVANAARGIATQVNNSIMQFVSNFMTALNPQITKSYGANDFVRYKNLMFKGSKLSVVLLSILSLPLFLNAKYILNLWLSVVPDFAVHFVVLVLIFSISEAFSNTFTTGLLATGRIKKLMIFVAGTRMINFPLSYLLLYYYGIPELTYCIAIILSQICLLIRLHLLKEYIQINVMQYYMNVVLRIVLLISISYIVPSKLIEYMNLEGFSSLLFSTIIAEILFVFLVYYIGFKEDEKLLIKEFTSKMILKYANKKNN